jgi:hydroxymethylglutaryl-CoA lyase
MNFPGHVKIVEVGPRDGLQNEAGNVPTAVKIELIERLAQAGLSVVEATAFVSPRWVPQMADHVAVMTGIHQRPGVSYTALVPNMKGFAAALAAGVREIAVFSSASETFSSRNTNCSITEGLARFGAVCMAAQTNGVRVRGYISCVLDCPYEGQIQPGRVADIAAELLNMGCYEVSLGDTIGMGTPGRTRNLVEVVTEKVPLENIAGHFHDTYGQALANAYAALECGVSVLDSSVAGLGGYPYAPGASGNVVSEDLLYMLDGMGIQTGVDMDKLIAAGNFICDFLGRPSGSKAARAVTAKRG